jgi:hypothetical protein
VPPGGAQAGGALIHGRGTSLNGHRSTVPINDCVLNNDSQIRLKS